MKTVIVESLKLFDASYVSGHGPPKLRAMFETWRVECKETEGSDWLTFHWAGNDFVTRWNRLTGQMGPNFSNDVPQVEGLQAGDYTRHFSVEQCRARAEEVLSKYPEAKNLSYYDCEPSTWPESTVFRYRRVIPGRTRAYPPTDVINISGQDLHVISLGLGRDPVFFSPDAPQVSYEAATAKVVERWFSYTNAAKEIIVDHDEPYYEIPGQNLKDWLASAPFVAEASQKKGYVLVIPYGICDATKIDPKTGQAKLVAGGAVDATTGYLIGVSPPGILEMIEENAVGSAEPNRTRNVLTTDPTSVRWSWLGSRNQLRLSEVLPAKCAQVTKWRGAVLRHGTRVIAVESSPDGQFCRIARDSTCTYYRLTPGNEPAALDWFR